VGTSANFGKDIDSDKVGRFFGTQWATSLFDLDFR